jgi:hypothetical protein
MGLVGAKCTARQTGMGSGSASRIYQMSSERSKKDAKFASYSRISPSSNLEPGTTDRNFPSSGTSYSTLPGSVPPVYKSTQGLGSNIPCTEVHETLYFRLDAVVSQSYSTPRGGDTDRFARASVLRFILLDACHRKVPRQRGTFRRQSWSEGSGT